jgi:hypothetical protein
MFESWSMNFKSSLLQRQLNRNFWSEDEIASTFESALKALVAMHSNQLYHGNISA